MRSKGGGTSQNITANSAQYLSRQRQNREELRKERHKLKRKGIIMLAAALCTALFASAAMAVTDDASLREAVKNDGTVTLENNIALDDSQGPLVIEKNVTLDLNGFELSRDSASTENSFVIQVAGGTLTINDGSANKTGTIKSTNANDQKARGIQIGTSSTTTGDDVGGTVFFNGGTIIADKEHNGYGVVLYGNSDKSAPDNREPIPVNFTMRDGAKIEAQFAGIATFGIKNTINIEGGEIISDAYAISGNGNKWNGGSEINISGGNITSTEDVAIYHPQDGVLNISGGTITGYDGVQMVGGALNITGGTIVATGEFNEKYEKNSDGSINGGAAVSILSRAGYVGEITVNISGNPTLKSTNGYAIAEATVTTNGTLNEDKKFNGMTISGGTFVAADGKDAIFVEFATTEDTKITGGTFSSDISTLSEKITVPPMAQDADGNFVAVTTPADTLEITSDSLEVAVGKTLQLKAVMTPEGANDKVVWSSSDEAVATVDQNGLVTGVSVGNVTIKGTITHTDSTLKDLESSLEIAVIEATTSDDVKPQPSGSGGGGCSAGFGALALLAALPLLRMRKK